MPDSDHAPNTKKQRHTYTRFCRAFSACRLFYDYLGLADSAQAKILPALRASMRPFPIVPGVHGVHGVP